ncbi:MAG: haloacid dehalogenase type II [Xanthobacteraceae bacterium]|nr:haloacid dehalogenase type II [Xanthobacteraceae bacterium]
MTQPPAPAQVDRRRLLRLATSAAAASTLAPAARAQPRARAVAFDGFVIFDPRPVATLAEELFPGKGEPLAALWRIRQFEYTWLRTLTGRYTDFWTVTRDALTYAAAATKVELTEGARDRLMQAFLTLKAYPDVADGLRALRDAGLRLAFLSNLTEHMLESAVASAGLDGLFEQNLSTDRVRAFKPDPRAYQMGIDVLGLSREEIVFAAFGGWDAAGAKSFGYRTFWANRLRLPVEELDVRPDAIGDNLQDLVRFATRG